jgi:probable phosphoglycerate mutase
METVIYLVRHGESEGNKAKMMRGREDFNLTSEGKRQAKAIARVAKEWKISAIFTSPLIRAKKTAKFIGRETKINPQIDEGFINIQLGVWEGKRQDWVSKNYPEEWSIWKTKPEILMFPGFEPLSKVSRRAYESLLKRTKEYTGRKICIVTHRAVLKCLIAKLLEIKAPYYWKIRMNTGSYSRIVYDGKMYYLDIFNEINHLQKEFL